MNAKENICSLIIFWLELAKNKSDFHKVNTVHSFKLRTEYSFTTSKTMMNYNDKNFHEMNAVRLTIIFRFLQNQFKLKLTPKFCFDIGIFIFFVIVFICVLFFSSFCVCPFGCDRHLIGFTMHQ